MYHPELRGRVGTVPRIILHVTSPLAEMKEAELVCVVREAIPKVLQIDEDLRRGCSDGR